MSSDFIPYAALADKLINDYRDWIKEQEHKKEIISGTSIGDKINYLNNSMAHKI